MLIAMQRRPTLTALYATPAMSAIAKPSATDALAAAQHLEDPAAAAAESAKSARSKTARYGFPCGGSN